MQGRKQFTAKLFYQTSLEDLVPQDNIYRLMNKELDLHYLYQKTSSYYGTEGQDEGFPFLYSLLISKSSKSSCTKSKTDKPVSFPKF